MAQEVLISLKNVTKIYKNGDNMTKALKNIDLDIFPGEFLCIVGESGCGKSTMLNLIGGLDSLSEGTITFVNQDISSASRKELTLYRRNHTGFVFQNYNLMNNLNARQNLDLIAELVENPMNSEEALRLVGLENKSNNYPSQLSGGQQQRLSIARALVKNPKIILADEPTAALDYETSIEVLTVLENVMNNKGTTLVMVTHNEEITKMADRIVRLKDGKIASIVVNDHKLKAIELEW